MMDRTGQVWRWPGIGDTFLIVATRVLSPRVIKHDVVWMEGGGDLYATPGEFDMISERQILNEDYMMTRLA